MRNSWKLGVYAALCASIAVVGCGDDDGEDGNNGGAGSGGGGTTNKGGASGSAGKANGGSSSGNGGTAGVTAGSGGKAGGGTGGTTAGTAGTAGTGNEMGGASDGGTAGAAVGGEGGAGGNPPDCTGEDSFGGADGEGGSGGAAPDVASAVILIDDIQVKDGATVKHQWQFADATQISPLLPGNNPGDKWSRWYGAVNPGSEIGLSCDGNPAAGSLKNLVPFTAASQYHELGVPFAPEDYTGLTITAKVKLVSGGMNSAACPARAALYVIGPDTKVGNDITPITGPGVALEEGAWVVVTQTVTAATGTTTIDRIGFNLNTYPCQ